MMGTLWPRSGTVERHADDLRAAGAQAFFFEGGTTAALVVFRDSIESSAFPIPVVADADGRWPDVFVPFITSYDVLVQSADGAQLTYTLEIPNANPVQSAPPTVSADVLLQTGMIHAEFVNSTKVGFVRLNGRTIGNASSGGTERAAADTESLFVYLWTNLNNTLAFVSGGRGVSAADDFALNKTIALPDLRGGILIGLSDMGAAANAAFAGQVFGAGNAVTAGSFTGNNSTTLTGAQLPSHTHTASSDTLGDHAHSFGATGVTGTENAPHAHAFSWSGTTTTENTKHTHSYTLTQSAGSQLSVTPGGTAIFGQTSADTGTDNVDHTHSYSGSSTTGNESASHDHNFGFGGTTGTAGNHSHTITVNATGSGNAFSNLPFCYLITWFIKL